MLTVISRLAIFSRLAAILIFAAPSVALADKIDAETHIGLQIALEQHIKVNSATGYYRFEDISAQQSLELTLLHLHPVIYKIGGSYLMCADFLDDSGETVLLDFIIDRREMGYIVTSIHRGQRSFFSRILEKIS